MALLRQLRLGEYTALHVLLRLASFFSFFGALFSGYLECDEHEEELAFYAWFDPNRYKHSHSGVLSEDGIEKMLEED